MKFEIILMKALKFFQVIYCYGQKAGYHRMQVKNILFTFDLNHLTLTAKLWLRFANQLHIMSLSFFDVFILNMFLRGSLCEKNLFHMINYTYES